MTYRAWNTKTVDRAALKELTAAIAQQNTEELEYQNMDEEWILLPITVSSCPMASVSSNVLL